MGSMTMPRRTLMGWFLLAARSRDGSKEKWLRVAPGAPMVKGRSRWNGHPECAKNARHNAAQTCRSGLVSRKGRNAAPAILA
ncbi:hypothetical protein PAGU2196_36230 [Pseudomonas sp. PAGU 2196]|nr:hypothetical protein PAGU2196_36230 [Pseudomonas sp. PAGU 2196]